MDSEGPGGIRHDSRSVVKCRGEVVSACRRFYEGGLDRSRDELTAFFAEGREVSREQSIRQIVHPLWLSPWEQARRAAGRAATRIGYRSVPRRITAATLK